MRYAKRNTKYCIFAIHNMLQHTLKYRYNVHNIHNLVCINYIIKAVFGKDIA